MSFSQFLTDDVLVPGIVKTLDVEAPVALEFLGCVDLVKLGRLLKKYGMNELFGIDISEALEAMEKEELKA